MVDLNFFASYETQCAARKCYNLFVELFTAPQTVLVNERDRNLDNMSFRSG